MDLKKLFINMAILGLFTFGIMAFIITTQSDNDVAIPIVNNTFINSTYGNLLTELDTAQPGMEKAATTFVNTTPTQRGGFLEVFPVISLTKSLRSIVGGVWFVMIQLPMVILGVPPIVAGVITAILIMIAVVGAWAIWKGVISQ